MMRLFKFPSLLILGCTLWFLVSCAAPTNVNSARGDDEDYFPINENGKFGFIDRTGKIVISPQFDSSVTEDGRAFNEGLVRFNSDKWGYIDKAARFVIHPNLSKSFHLRSFMTDWLKSKLVEVRWVSSIEVEICQSAQICWRKNQV